MHGTGHVRQRSIRVEQIIVETKQRCNGVNLQRIKFGSKNSPTVLEIALQWLISGRFLLPDSRPTSAVTIDDTNKSAMKLEQTKSLENRRDENRKENGRGESRMDSARFSLLLYCDQDTNKI